MIAGIWFSFVGDAACLVKSVATFRSAMPGCPVAVFDDGRSPVPASTIAQIEPELYEQTSWPRVGNLNGWPAVRGILESCDLVSARFGVCGTLKLDCDTVILSGRWLDPARPVVGWDCGWIRSAAGMCRYLRADVPSRLLSGLDRRPLIDHPVAEDMAISAEASFEYPGEVLLHPRQPGTADGFRLAGWSYRWASEGRFGLAHPAGSHDVVTFGNRAQLDCTGTAARLAVAQAMMRFREGLQAP
jgi:hypothetical protein